MRDDTEKMMLNYDNKLTLELEEIIATLNEPKQSKKDEEEKEPVKSDLLPPRITRDYYTLKF